MTKYYLATRDVADLLGVSRRTIEAYVAQGRLPEPDVIVGLDSRGAKGWEKERIVEWNANRPGAGNKAK